MVKHTTQQESNQHSSREIDSAHDPRRTISADTPLPDLAAAINTYHQAATQKATQAIEYARRVGELLIEAKAQMPHGKWLPWLEANCRVSARQVTTYVKIASGWGQISEDRDSKSEAASDLSIRGAMRLLAGPDGEPEPTAKRHPNEPQKKQDPQGELATPAEPEIPDCLRDGDGNMPTQTMSEWQASNVHLRDSDLDAERLEYHTQVIRHGLYERWQAAKAFRDIRDERLFRDETATFEGWLLLNGWLLKQVEEFIADPINADSPENVSSPRTRPASRRSW